MKTCSREETRLLLYFETRAVDYGGTVESARMSVDDFAIANRWNESGFVHFERIAFHDIKNRNGVAVDHWCVLSEAAWKLAHAERRARCTRKMAALAPERKALPAEQAFETQRDISQIG